MSIPFLTAWLRLKRTIAYAAISVGLLTVSDLLLAKQFHVPWREMVVAFGIAVLSYYSKYGREINKGD